MVNDLEAVVFPRWPELRDFRDALLDAGAEQALLSGSGSTVYGVFEDREKAAGASGRLESEYGQWRLTVTRIVDRGVRITAR